ncbi:MAG TPA: RNA-binding domain-containing protein [Chloroflexia bacterium]|jgi:hypothetical protein
MTDEQFSELIALLVHEQRGIEVKGPGLRTDRQLAAKVVRAALSMSNRRTGGLIIIGIDEQNGAFTPTGLSDVELATWRYDDVSTLFALYADPPISFRLEVRVHNEQRFVLLNIDEFSDIPVLCRRDNDPVLREGACYVRSRRRPETAEIPSHADMRDLIELATEKGIKRFLGQMQTGGISISEVVQAQDEALFDQQHQGWEGGLLEQLQPRGHWKVTIRPSTFARERVTDMASLLPLLMNRSVNLGGWYFPLVLANPIVGNDWIMEELNKPSAPEVWRFYQSAQFTDYFGMWEDWRNDNRHWQPGEVLMFESAVTLVTGIFVFASQLAVSDLYQMLSSIHMEIQVMGIQNRQLKYEAGAGSLFLPHTSAIPDYTYKQDFSREELVATPKELALHAVKQILLRFSNFTAPLAVLQGIQERVQI